MNIVAWIIVGLVAGLLARWIVRDDRSGCLYTVAVGVLGALIGGALMHAGGHEGINEFSIRSLLVAAAGAILLLLVLQAIGGRGRIRRR
jgi:uncharacterized membrane protein YeaQ/YmgE (transglycosylase-associated protein family)